MSLGSTIGLPLHRFSQNIISHRAFPLTRYFPYGSNWYYDMQRFAGTKDFGAIFDVGANDGETAWGLVRYFPRSPIHCFEPVKSTFADLVRNYGDRKNITFVNKALGAQPGTSTIYLHEHSGLNTLVPGTSTTEREGIGAETVIITTVEGYCAENGIDKVRVLKMDVQGWEMEVLKGAENMLRQDKIQFVFAEVAFRDEGSDMQAFSPLNTYMHDVGYDFCGFYEVFRHGPAKQFVSFANALYINPRFVP